MKKLLIILAIMFAIGIVGTAVGVVDLINHPKIYNSDFERDFSMLGKYVILPMLCACILFGIYYGLKSLAVKLKNLANGKRKEA